MPQLKNSIKKPSWRQCLFLIGALLLCSVIRPMHAYAGLQTQYALINKSSDNSETFVSAPYATIRPLEVRTKKLHLVRPDLLRYPIRFDVCC
jgi:hypothetical protein